MKQPQAAAPASLFLGLLSGPTIFAEANEDLLLLSIRGDGITFDVIRFDDGRNRPYHVSFEKKDVSSTFEFDEAGYIEFIEAGTEEYAVRYKSNGSFRKVIRKDAGDVRMLLEKNEEELFLNGSEGSFTSEGQQRRFNACDDCEDAWTLVCGNGISTVCDLVDNSVLGSLGTSSVATMCDTFEDLCASTSAESACDGQCEGEGESSSNYKITDMTQMA